MKKSITFTVIGKQPLSSSKKKHKKNFRDKIIREYCMAAHEIGFSSFDKNDAIELDVLFYFESANDEADEYKLTSPDVDNLCKVLMDCLDKRGANIFPDDGQVARLMVEKRFHSLISKTVIKISQL